MGLPKLDAQRKWIDIVSSFVASVGLAFESFLRSELEEGAFLLQNGVNIKFLDEFDTPDAVYYRWRVYAFTQGDTKSKWRTEPFQITRQGVVYVPPPVPKRSEISRSRSR